jgi:hypothetical protein
LSIFSPECAEINIFISGKRLNKISKEYLYRMENQRTIPSNFRTIIVDFIKDLSTTFPEYSHLWSTWTGDFSDEDLLSLYNYCLTIYPQRFFDIIYQSDDAFKPDGEINTNFLPGVDFKLLYNCEGVSETTKKALWKYLQLLLFTVINDVKDKTTFGDTMNLFEGIDEKELQSKLQETILGLADFFKNASEKKDGETADAPEFKMPDFDMPEFKMPEFKMPEFKMPEGAANFEKMFENMPDMEKIQEHLKTLFDGKIGSLAKEMAEEISHEFADLLGDDPNNIDTTKDAMKNLMKNPQKLMALMKKISSKLDEKMQSGDISKEELMKEASEMIGKMKGMGGADQFKEMFEKMAKNMGGLGKNMRLDTNAMTRMSKQEAMRDRLRKKMEAKRQQTLQNEIRSQPVNYSLQQTSNPNNLVFKLGEETAQEKSYIHPDLLSLIEQEEKEKTATKNAPQKSKSNKKKKSKK